MGHIVQRLVRNAIMQAVNQVIQKKPQDTEMYISYSKCLKPKE